MRDHKSQTQTKLSLGKDGNIEKKEEVIPQVPLMYSYIDIEPKKDMYIVQMIPKAEQILKSGIVLEGQTAAFIDNVNKAIIVRKGKEAIEYNEGQLVVLSNPGVVAVVNGINFMFCYESTIVGVYDNVLIELDPETID